MSFFGLGEGMPVVSEHFYNYAELSCQATGDRFGDFTQQ